MSFFNLSNSSLIPSAELLLTGYEYALEKAKKILSKPERAGGLLNSPLQARASPGTAKGALLGRIPGSVPQKEKASQEILEGSLEFLGAKCDFEKMLSK